MLHILFNRGLIGAKTDPEVDHTGRLLARGTACERGPYVRCGDVSICPSVRHIRLLHIETAEPIIKYKAVLNKDLSSNSAGHSFAVSKTRKVEKLRFSTISA